mmetsp:Transcript_11202/g.24097  ORF Transcript_11202/g.24097 Transcript_11202/m.24097 type:complete len:90 (+) Transcript_11202:231-500(+)
MSILSVPSPPSPHFVSDGACIDEIEKEASTSKAAIVATKVYRDGANLRSLAVPDALALALPIRHTARKAWKLFRSRELLNSRQRARPAF